MKEYLESADANTCGDWFFPALNEKMDLFDHAKVDLLRQCGFLDFDELLDYPIDTTLWKYYRKTKIGGKQVLKMVFRYE